MVKDDDEYEDENEDDDYEPPARKRGGGGTKKVFIVILILIIIIAAFGVFWMTGSVKEVIINSPVELDDGSGIAITVQTPLEGGGSASGEGTVEIIYKSETVYSEKININRDIGRKEIPYDKFVIGNDLYEIRVTFEGKSGSTFFKLYDEDGQYQEFGWAVAENINITASLSSYEQNDNIKLKVLTRLVDENNLNLAPPKKATIEITIKHEDGSPQTYKKDITYPNASYEFNEYDYLSTGSGNYTIEAKLENHYIKTSSKYKDVEIDQPLNIFFNIYAVADPGDNRVERVPVGSSSVNIQFDGSGSWDDGEILRYEWDFDYKDEDGDNYSIPDFTVDAVGIQTNHDFELVSGVLKEYTVALRIIGDFLGIDEEEIFYDVSTETCTVTVSRV